VKDPLVDVRGPRFSAGVTTVVLAVALVTQSAVLLGVQLAIFLLGAVLGLRFAPYGVFFRVLIRPRLGPPREFEHETPPRFAQAVGAVFALVGTIGFAAGWSALGLTATAFALAAAFLNVAFGLCLGCEMYLLYRRATARPAGGRSFFDRSRTGASSTRSAEGVGSATRRGVEA
jgi:Domain of unknown function (DUF4395)